MAKAAEPILAKIEALLIRLCDERDALRAENAKLREALEWFADKKNYNHSAGDMARAALSKGE